MVADFTHGNDSEDQLVPESASPTTLAALSKSWTPLTDDFPLIEDLPPEPFDL